jgi:hypothetical protein
MTDRPQSVPGELHVWRSPFETDVVYVVNAITLANAKAADDAPYLETFGELRCSGEVGELTERLDNQYNVSLETYVSAIETAASREPTGTDLESRLDALSDIEFAGADADDGWCPGDDTEFRTDWETEVEPAEEYRGLAVIMGSSKNDLPADVFAKFGKENWGDSPAFGGFIDCGIKIDQLDDALAELRSRGYVIIDE